MQNSLTSHDFLMVGAQLYQALISGELSADQLTVNKRTTTDQRSFDKTKQSNNSTIDPHRPHPQKKKGSWLCGGGSNIPIQYDGDNSNYRQNLSKQQRSQSNLNFSGSQLVDWLCQNFDAYPQRKEMTEFNDKQTQRPTTGTVPIEVGGVNARASNKGVALTTSSDQPPFTITQPAGKVKSPGAVAIIPRTTNSNSIAIETDPEQLRQRMRQISAQLVNARVIAPTVLHSSRRSLSTLDGIFIDDPTQQYEYVGVNLNVDPALRKRSRRWSRHVPNEIETNHDTINSNNSTNSINSITSLSANSINSTNSTNSTNSGLQQNSAAKPNLTSEIGRTHALDRGGSNGASLSFLTTCGCSSTRASSKFRSNRITPSELGKKKDMGNEKASSDHNDDNNDSHIHDRGHEQHDNTCSSWDRWRDPAPVIFWEWYLYGQLPGGFIATA